MAPLVVSALLLLGAAASFARDRRTLRTGVLLLGALLALAAYGFGRLLADAPVALGVDEADAWILLGALAVVLLTVLLLAGYLIATGIQLVRRERRSPARSLSLLLGLCLLGYLAAPIGAIAADDAQLMVWFMLTVPPVGLLALLFAAYLLYVPIYATAVRRSHRHPDAVIVLGARVVGSEPTPLLRSRLDAGIRAWSRARAAGPCVLVTSGGQGPDEIAPEGRIMADYARRHGVDDTDLVVEDRSRTTEENLRLSRRLLAERGVDGPVLVATSDFHALRAAMLLRSLSIPGDAIGGRTAQYYRPTATIREFVAVLRDRRVPVLIALGLCATPLAVGLVVTALSAL